MELINNSVVYNNCNSIDVVCEKYTQIIANMAGILKYV